MSMANCGANQLVMVTVSIDFIPHVFVDTFFGFLTVLKQVLS